MSGRLPTRPARGEMSQLALWRVLDRSESDLADELSLTELAAVVDLSPYHFARAFKASFGAPPRRYQIELQVERARELLASSNRSVTEIAYACGFAYSQHMASAFRRFVGTTPSA